MEGESVKSDLDDVGGRSIVEKVCSDAEKSEYCIDDPAVDAWALRDKLDKLDTTDSRIALRALVVAAPLLAFVAAVLGAVPVLFMADDGVDSIVLVPPPFWEEV